MYSSLYVKVTAAAAISSLMAQIYTLNHEIDPSLARSPPFVSRASLATSAVIITFRQRERRAWGDRHVLGSVSQFPLRHRPRPRPLDAESGD